MVPMECGNFLHPPWNREGISSNHRSKANVFGDRPWTPSSSERWGSRALRWRRWWRPPSTPRECWDELDDFEGWAGKVTWEQRKVMSIRAWKYGDCRNVYTISEDRDWLVVYLPLWKICSSVGMVFHSQLFLESHSKFHGSSHHQPVDVS